MNCCSIGFGIGGGLRFARNFVVGPAFRFDFLSPNQAFAGGGSWQVGGQLAWLGKSDAFGFAMKVEQLHGHSVARPVRADSLS